MSNLTIVKNLCSDDDDVKYWIEVNPFLFAFLFFAYPSSCTDHFCGFDLVGSILASLGLKFVKEPERSNKRSKICL